MKAKHTSFFLCILSTIAFLLFGCESSTANNKVVENKVDQPSKAEKEAASTPLPGGPFRNFLSALHRLQSEYSPEQAPIRTALITARSAPAHERVIRTLRAWDIRIDEVVFLGGLDKGDFLRTFGADIFFDDQRGYCDSARQFVPTGHVPHGITNDPA